MKRLATTQTRATADRARAEKQPREIQIGLPGVILGTTIVALFCSMLLMPQALASAGIIAVIPIWLSIRWFFELRRGTKATWVDRFVVVMCFPISVLIAVCGFGDILSQRGWI